MTSNATVTTPAPGGPWALIPSSNSREIVRLIQCSQCSYPLREPMTLPCGYSLCRRCLPPAFKRENISYPQDPGRAEGLVCPFRDCGMTHALGDCSLDVTLNKISETVRTYIDTQRTHTSHTPIQLDEKLHWPTVIDSAIDIMPRSRVLHGGRVVATYVFADMGELNYASDVAYAVSGDVSQVTVQALDLAVVDQLKEIVRGDLECQVCYALMLDPLTTSCGHTFCRKCVARVLDHTNLCPVCRRRMAIAPGVQAEPSNKRISGLLSGLLAEQLQERVTLAAQEEEAPVDDTSLPLFPCTLAYPSMPTFLHIFEPRYRLMIRRCVENGTRRFGILGYNQFREPQGSLGRTPFLQYGTALHIQRLEMLADGRSLIETTGVYRFRVLQSHMVDGYIMGNVQRVDDISVAEEEMLEARERLAAAQSTQENEQNSFDAMSTQQLLQYGLNFITRAQSQSANWLHERVLAAYGQPPSDPATFPYWFASVLPISEREKYLLLPATSVRERLKLTAGWIHRLEHARCNHDPRFARSVLDPSDEEEEEEDEDDDDDDEEEDGMYDAYDADQLDDRAVTTMAGANVHPTVTSDQAHATTTSLPPATPALSRPLSVHVPDHSSAETASDSR